MENKHTTLPQVTIGKKKYHELIDAIEKEFDYDTSLRISKLFCKLFNFDPSIPCYTKERGLMSAQWKRDKANELGCKSYQVSTSIHLRNK